VKIQTPTSQPVNQPPGSHGGAADGEARTARRSAASCCSRGAAGCRRALGAG